MYMRFNWTSYSILALALGVTLSFAPERGPERAEAPLLPNVTAAAVKLGAPVAPPVAPPVPAMSEDDRLTARAIDVLSRYVVKQSHPAALRYAFDAYFNYRVQNPDKVRKPYLYYVDFGLASTEPRGYVFDMEGLTLVEGPFTVAHGNGSARGGSPVPTRFSNRPGSNATSLGLYLTGETYGFRGKSGGRPYRSIGLRMDGVSGGFNSAARRRGVVVHGAPYVTSGKAGRSEGCPAMEPGRAERLLPMLAGGALVFHFSPNDREWLRLEPWIDTELAMAAPGGEMVSLR